MKVAADMRLRGARTRLFPASFRIKKLAGQDAKQEWYHQFLDKDTDIKRLANKINSYFVGLTDHFQPLLSLTHISPCHRFRL